MKPPRHQWPCLQTTRNAIVRSGLPITAYRCNATLITSATGVVYGANKSKCWVLSITRNKNIVSSIYKIQGVDVKITESQKDLGVFVTTSLKWNQHLQFVTAKASKMLGFMRRCTFDIQHLSVRRSLYLALVRNPLAYCSQVWSPQTVTLLYSLERIQRRATKLILSLPFRTEFSYKTRLLRLELVPLCY